MDACRSYWSVLFVFKLLLLVAAVEMLLSYYLLFSEGLFKCCKAVLAFTEKQDINLFN